MKNILITSFILLMGICAAAQSNEKIVQQQLEAYNNKTIEKFLSAFSDDIQLFNFPGEKILEGKEQMRLRYEIRFESPNLHAEVVSRTVIGDYIIDHERVTGINDGIVEASVIYHVGNGLIDKMWFIIK